MKHVMMAAARLKHNCIHEKSRLNLGRLLAV